MLTIYLFMIENLWNYVFHFISLASGSSVSAVGRPGPRNVKSRSSREGREAGATLLSRGHHSTQPQHPATDRKIKSSKMCHLMFKTPKVMHTNFVGISVPAYIAFRNSALSHSTHPQPQQPATASSTQGNLPKLPKKMYIGYQDEWFFF